MRVPGVSLSWRWTSKKDGGRALTPFSERILGNGDRVLAVHHFRRIVAFTPPETGFTLGVEAFVAALLGGKLANNSPPGERTRYSHAWGGGVPRAEREVAAAIDAAGGPAGAARMGLNVVKNAIQQSFVDNDATISHHHGVGVEHSPWLADDISPAGVAVMSGLFASADPKGNFNPGKILPRAAAKAPARTSAAAKTATAKAPAAKAPAAKKPAARKPATTK